MRKRHGFLIVLAVIVLILPAFSQAATINLWSAFPDNQGDNGFYAYAYQAGRTTPYRVLTDGGSYRFDTPEQANPPGYSVYNWDIPYIARAGANPTDGFLSIHPSANTQMGYVFGPEDVVLAWLVPANNTYDINGNFLLRGATDDGTHVYIRKNAAVIWEANLTSSGDQAVFNLLGIQLSAGDLLYFGVGARGNDYGDSTALQGTIAYNAVPLPGSILFLGTGLLYLAHFRRRQSVARS